MRAPRLKIADPGLFSLKRAARAAIVLPAVVALADTVIKQPQTTFLAAIGSVAMLVLADFGGPPRTRLAAYLGLAAAGVVLVPLGTLCSRPPWLAVVAMAAIGFTILLSGVISGYFAAARLPALLTFTLPVSIPAPPSAIPARLEGWALAASAAIAAVMLLWPSQPPNRLRAGAARATRALADLVDAELSGDPAAISERTQAADTAVGELRAAFVATPYRPTGATGATEALAFLVDGLDWLRSFASPLHERADAPADPCREENREVMAAVVAVLRASAANLDSERAQPDLDRLDRAREAVAGGLVQRVTGATGPDGDVDLAAVLEPSFRMHELSFAAHEVAVNALSASGAADRVPGRRGVVLRARSALRESARLLVAHAGRGSASFRNAVRGATGVSLAVLISQLASLQHSFWVVLAMLSVLRSNALGTGSTVVQALAGTAAGIVVGGVLVVAIGTNEWVLWLLLPPAMLLAAYAPRAISFAAGQAGFTIVLLILFNIIQPTGWTVGLVRVEDVAVGFGVSLAVGALFWPRGVGDLVRKALGAAYARSAEYVAASTGRLVATTGPRGTETARQMARDAASRLDDASREYVAESPAQRANLQAVSALAAGATRVRLAGYSLSTLPAAPAGGPSLNRCADALARDVGELSSWYAALAHALADGTAVPPPRPGKDDRRDLAQCARQALAAGDETMVGPALGVLWASEHIESLRELEARLIEPATELSG